MGLSREPAGRGMGHRGLVMVSDQAWIDRPMGTDRPWLGPPNGAGRQHRLLHDGCLQDRLRRWPSQRNTSSDRLRIGL
jgi:hypothetical protein